MHVMDLFNWDQSVLKYTLWRTVDPIGIDMISETSQAKLILVERVDNSQILGHS